MKNNINTDILCKNQDNLDVHYKGEYLQSFLPHALQEQENILVIYWTKRQGVSIGKIKPLKPEEAVKDRPC